MAIDKRFLLDLAKIVGEKNVLTDDANLSIFSSGAVDILKGYPEVVIHITDTDQVSRIVSLANKNNVPIVARGGGSSVTGAVVPTEGGIVLDLKALKKVKVDVENGYVIAEAGATILEVDSECRKYGFFFPPDPSSAKIATIGGSLAENSGGMRCARYGVMRDWVLKIEVVLADGTVTAFGESTYKNRVGYDFLGLMIGSEGTLGIITKAWMKFMPLSEKIVRTAAFFERLDEAGEAIMKIRSEGINPLILEYADRPGVEAANKVKGFNYPETDGGMVLVDIDGPKDCVEKMADKVVKIMEESHSAKIIRPTNLNELEDILDVRRIAFTGPGRLYPGFIDGDMAVPLSRIKDALEGIKDIRKEFNVFIATAGHVGDGNFHCNIGADPGNEDEWSRALQAAKHIDLLALKLGGTVSAEHGIGKLKEEVFLRQLEERGQMMVYQMMKQVKRMLDPKNILNPNKYALGNVTKEEFIQDKSQMK